MSRNRDRLGNPEPQADTSPAAQQMLAGETTENSGFSFVVPTEFVDLPSGGKYYPEGHPLHKTDCIEIKQMTAKEEDILTSRTLLKKGLALERVIASLIVDRRIDPNTLLIGDRNAIIIAARVSGYGNEYSTQVTCPACGEAQEYEFDLNEARVYDGEDIDGVTVEYDRDENVFHTTLPRTNVEVSFRLLDGRDEKRISKAAENERKSNKGEKNITRQLTNIITSVNGDDSKEAIKYAVNNMPSRDSRHLRLAYRLVAPNVDLTQQFSCCECDHEQEMEVPLSADFFWPDR